MSIFDRLGSAFGRATAHSQDSDEHRAVVDLLVLTVYADHRVSQEELEALAQFDVQHRESDEGSFGIEQYLGPSIAKVRAATDSPEQVDQLLSEISAALTTPALRAEAASYCQAVAEAGGEVSTDETGFIAKVKRLLG